MADNWDSSTGTTLYGLLRDLQNQLAWERFVERYGPKILAWCRRWEVPEDDALEVSQTVFAKLVEKITTYDRDKGPFRPWLKAVAHNAWNDCLRKQKRAGVGAGDSEVQRQLASAVARDDLAREVEAAWERDLLEAALNRVRPNTPPRDWGIFHAIAVEGRPAQETADALGLPVTTVYQAKFRVQKAVRAEIARLEGDDPGC